MIDGLFRQATPGPAEPAAKVRGATTKGGWGYQHAQARKRLAPHVQSGNATCARCGRPISPGEPWDLDHDDNDRSRYLGPSHRGCNRATAGRKVRQGSRKW